MGPRQANCTGRSKGPRSAGGYQPGGRVQLERNALPPRGQGSAGSSRRWGAVAPTRHHASPDASPCRVQQPMALGPSVWALGTTGEPVQYGHRSTASDPQSRIFAARAGSRRRALAVRRRARGQRADTTCAAKAAVLAASGLATKLGSGSARSTRGSCAWRPTMQRSTHRGPLMRSGRPRRRRNALAVVRPMKHGPWPVRLN
jgi:hypothetical protein